MDYSSRSRIVPISGILSVLIGMSLLTACDINRSPDQSIHICLDGQGAAQGVMSVLKEISKRHKYEFVDSGLETRDGILEIGGEDVVPRGVPIQFYVDRPDESVALMGSNFGSHGNDVLVSFFFQDSEGMGSSFNKDVLSGIKSIPDTRVYPSGRTGSANSPC